MANGDVTVSLSVNGTTVLGKSVNFSGTQALSGVAEQFCQEFPVTTTATTVASIAVGSGAAVDLSDVKAIAIQNLSTTVGEYIIVGGIDSGAKAIYAKVDIGAMILLSNKEVDANITGGAFAALTDLTSVTIQSATGTPSVSILAIN